MIHPLLWCWLVQTQRTENTSTGKYTPGFVQTLMAIQVFLPTVRKAPNGSYYYADMPARLADNIKYGYADFYDWNYAISHFDTIIEKAFNNRASRRNLIDNSRPQMQRNLGV